MSLPSVRGRTSPSSGSSSPALRARFAAHPIVAPLSEEGRAALWSAGRVVHFRAGEQLTREGDDVEFYWLLLSGSVRVYYTSVQALR